MVDKGLLTRRWAGGNRLFQLWVQLFFVRSWVKPIICINVAQSTQKRWVHGMYIIPVALEDNLVDTGDVDIGNHVSTQEYYLWLIDSERQHRTYAQHRCQKLLAHPKCFLLNAVNIESMFPCLFLNDMLTGRCHWDITFTTDTLLGRFPSQIIPELAEYTGTHNFFEKRKTKRCCRDATVSHKNICEKAWLTTWWALMNRL